MKKIDEKLFNFVTLSEKDCNLECLVYYIDKLKTLDFFAINNIKVIKEIPFLNIFVACFNSDKIIKTASQNFILYISSISSVNALMNVSRKIINAENLPLTGKGVTIAFIDTGISQHIDFSLGKNRILFFKDFVNNYDLIYDDNGHGTFVTGVASGSGVLSNGEFKGIAPDSKIISLKALDGRGEANALTILDAMQWVYDNHKKFNIKVVCMSFGSEPLGNRDPIMKGAEKLWQSGVCVVCAGGNSGPDSETIKSPGISKKIITVGGLDDHRNDDGSYDINKFEVAKFSSRGPAMGRVKPDIIAPGVNITSCSHLGGYKKMSGTSVATPIVAGTCAVIYEKYPNISPDEIKKYLLNNAKNIKSSRFAQGYGYLNIT